MKKATLLFCIAAFLFVIPTTQATFVSNPIEEVLASTASSPATIETTTEGITGEGEVSITSTRTGNIKRLSFFKKLKRFFAPVGKSKLTAALLAFFLWPFGAHRFYLGHSDSGLLQLLMGVGSFAMFCFAFAVTDFTGIVYAAGALLLGFGLFIWASMDFFRILSGKLKPKDGDYEKKI